MLSEEVLERISEKLSARMENLNTYMIEEIGNQLREIGELTPSQARRIYQSIKYGNNINKIKDEIAKVTDLTNEDIDEIFEEVAKQQYYEAKVFYDFKNIPFIPYEENKTLQNMVKAIAKVTKDTMQNISNTTVMSLLDSNGDIIYTPLEDVYKKITDEAIINISTGQEAYGMQSRKIMRRLAKDGIQKVEYESGLHRRIDTAVRMNVLEGVRQMSQQLQEQFGTEFGANGIEVVHHKNPAPDHSNTPNEGEYEESHDIDGKQFTIEEYQEINKHLKRPVGTLNCYHTTRYIILGINRPLYTKEELEADKKANNEGFEYEGKHYTNYEGTQLQRRLETKIREYKDRQIGAKALGDKEEAIFCQEKISQIRDKYNELSKISGLPTKIDRMRVENYRKISTKS